MKKNGAVGAYPFENVNIRNFAKYTEWTQTEFKESDMKGIPYIDST